MRSVWYALRSTGGSLRAPVALAFAVVLASTMTLAFAATLTSGQAAQPESKAKPATVENRAAESIVDEFHPDRALRDDGTRAPLPPPAFGGRAIVQIEALPKSLCYALDSSGVLRRILYELHETLLLRNWETFEFEPVLCASYTVEDRLVLAGEKSSEVLFGRVSEDGDTWLVTPISAENPLKAARRVPKTGVERIERGTVFTWRLRPGVRWHDGEPFHARDVAFSLSIYANPTVRCDDKRFAYADIERVETLDDMTVRVTYGKQYFMALASLGDLFLLPAHLYDLSDPDNARFDAGYHAQKKALDPNWKPTSAEQGAYVNDNVHNRAFVGLGPYMLANYTSEFVEARRFEGYFDPRNAGYLDTLRWRAIPDAAAAFRAFLNGELDFFDMVTTDDYFSSATESKEFQARAYRGWHDTSVYWFIGWNCAKPALADPRVRRALAHMFDFDEFKSTFYRGLARQVTGMFSPRSPAYATDVKPYGFDPKEATRLLAEAGWYDRDGDGRIDKDGKPLEIELLMQAGNAVGLAFSAKFQENLARIGVRLAPTALDWAALNQRKSRGDFDAVALGWAPPFESDPEQMFHSRWGKAEKKGSNFVAFVDDEADRLIESGRRELDDARRAAIWRQLHQRLYELQPYLFCFNPPRKFVMNKALRGFQGYALDPNYVLRRWYYAAGTPATRATLGRP